MNSRKQRFLHTTSTKVKMATWNILWNVFVMARNIPWRNYIRSVSQRFCRINFIGTKRMNTIRCCPRAINASCQKTDSWKLRKEPKSPDKIRGFRLRCTNVHRVYFCKLAKYKSRFLMYMYIFDNFGKLRNDEWKCYEPLDFGEAGSVACCIKKKIQPSLKNVSSKFKSLKQN